MPKPPLTLTESFEEMTKKANLLRERIIVLQTTVQQRRKEREAALAALREKGIKKPEDAEYRKTFIGKKKAELKELIERTSEEIDDAITRLEEVGEQGS